jgi:signal transduction histidine kinase
MNKFGSLNIKIALLLSGVIIVFLILYYTQVLVDQIQQREKQIADLYAKSLEYMANDTIAGEYSFVFTQILTKIDFPIIATDKDYKSADFYINIDLDTIKMSKKEINDYLLKEAKKMTEINPPFKVSVKDTLILKYVNYGQSSLVTKLKYFPVVALIVGAIFILLGYTGFSYIKKNEQSSIWVGLSRETAHQLGTPLSSLFGWVEILKTLENNSQQLDEITDDIEKDVDKLKMIAGRFSKIGSKPELKKENLFEVIDSVSHYFEKRIPTLTSIDGQKTKKINIEINCDKNIYVKINRDLFEWVIENLLKNSFDAIDKNNGKIDFNVTEREKEFSIDVTDNGRGIDKKVRKDIFRPGYSTKKRGWGLGLSLSKRIIEDYHKGKLNLIDSNTEEGTVFRIKLNKNITEVEK